MPPEALNVMHPRTLTTTINKIDQPLRALTQLLYPESTTELVETEAIDVSFVDRGRKMAPLTRKGSEAYLLPMSGFDFATVAPANIRVKKPFDPHKLLFRRYPGTPVYNSTAAQRAGRNKYVRDEIADINNRIANTKEWLVAQTLRGQISYTIGEDDKTEIFTVTFPRSADTGERPR